MNDYGGSSDVGATGRETCAYLGFTTGQWKIGQDISPNYHLHECKSISGEKIDKIKDGVWDDLEQFLQGIGSVPALNNYHLHFNKAVFSGDLLKAKKAMQGLFKVKGEEIFKRMWDNNSLRINTFKDLNGVPIQSLETAKIEFYKLVNIELNDPNAFFNFVQ